jgi:hypothetical protein
LALNRADIFQKPVIGQKKGPVMVQASPTLVSLTVIAAPGCTVI